MSSSLNFRVLNKWHCSRQNRTHWLTLPYQISVTSTHHEPFAASSRCNMQKNGLVPLRVTVMENAQWFRQKKITKVMVIKDNLKGKKINGDRSSDNRIAPLYLKLWSREEAAVLLVRVYQSPLSDYLHCTRPASRLPCFIFEHATPPQSLHRNWILFQSEFRPCW
jgi:hypothetical protein